MKILIIHYKSRITGGPELYFHAVMEELSLRGHEVVSFSYNWLNEDYNPSWAGEGTERFSFSGGGESAINSIRRIPRMVNNRFVADDLGQIIFYEKPDVALVLLFLGKLTPTIFDTLCRFNVTYYVRISDFSSICSTSTLFKDDVCTRCIDHGPLQGVVHNCAGTLSSSFMHYIMRLSLSSSKYRFAKGFLVPSKNSIGLLSKAKLYSGANLIHLPTFSPVEDSLPPDEDPTEKRVIAYWGRVSPEKNVKELAVWMVNQAASHPEWTYRIVGFDSSVYSSETRAVFKGMLNCECYEFAPLTDCIELFTESTFFVSSTLIYDNFPQSPLVALSLGVKVILPDFGSYRDVITNEKMGFLYTNLEELDFMYTSYEYDRNLVRKLYFDNFGKAKHFETLERILCQK